MTTKPTTIILSGFALVIFLVLALLATSLYQLNLTKITLHDSIAIQAQQADWANTLQDITHKRSAVMLGIIHTKDDFIRDDMIQQLYSLGEGFMLKRQDFYNADIDKEETNLINEHKKHAITISSFQHQAIDLSLSGKYHEAEELFISMVLPLQQENTERLNKLSQHQNNEIKTIISSLILDLNNLYLGIFFAGIFIIIVCVVIAVFIYERLTHNITDMQKVRDDLFNSLGEVQNLKHALDQHAIVSISDITGKITHINDKFVEVSQYSENELIGRDHNILNSGYHDNHFFRNMWATITSGATWSGEIRNRKKDGNYYWVKTTIVPFLDNNGIPYQYIAIRTDITNIINTEQELARTLGKLATESEKAKESNALKSSIISTMTHELKTPLNSILGFSQLLLLEEKNLPEMQVDNINNIIESGNELLYNIENIMLYSKLKSNTTHIQNSNIELNLLLQSVIDDIKKKNISNVLPALESSKALDISADTNLLRKVFYYVIDNAVKFTAKGHIAIKFTQIAKHAAIPDHSKVADKDLILITIKDTGIGIPPEKMHVIFDEFRQAEEENDRHFEGVGIGLTLAKNIINLHNGDIWLSSEVNIGTVVYITIPNIKTDQ